MKIRCADCNEARVICTAGELPLIVYCGKLDRRLGASSYCARSILESTDGRQLGHIPCDGPPAAP